MVDVAEMDGSMFQSNRKIAKQVSDCHSCATAPLQSLLFLGDVALSGKNPRVVIYNVTFTLLRNMS
jgi:hypothetical protein